MCLVSFTQHNVFKVHPCVRTSFLEKVVSPSGFDLYFPDAHLGFDPKFLNFQITALSTTAKDQDKEKCLGERKCFLSTIFSYGV